MKYRNVCSEINFNPPSNNNLSERMIIPIHHTEEIEVGKPIFIAFNVIEVVPNGFFGSNCHYESTKKILNVFDLERVEQAESEDDKYPNICELIFRNSSDMIVVGTIDDVLNLLNNNK